MCRPLKKSKKKTNKQTNKKTLQHPTLLNNSTSHLTTSTVSIMEIFYLGTASAAGHPTPPAASSTYFPT